MESNPYSSTTETHESTIPSSQYSVTDVLTKEDENEFNPYSSVLRWLGAPVIPSSSKQLCGSCNTTLSPKAGHCARCKKDGDITSRHNRLRDLIFALCSNACLAPVKELSGLDPLRPQRRPADVFIPNFQGGRDAALDIAVTCPLQPKFAAIVDDPADHYADTVKHRLYDPGFKGLPVDFIPVVFDGFGGVCAEGLSCLLEIMSRGAARALVPRQVYISQCWQRISVCLQRCNARMVASRLSPPVLI